MKVAAVIVTRGDVEIQPIVDSIPQGWEILVWENGHTVSRSDGYAEHAGECAVYGRYAAIHHTSADVIYVQDDDVLVSSPQQLLEEWLVPVRMGRLNHVVCNMPPEYRHDFYQAHALVGFGAVFHRDSPFRAFAPFLEQYTLKSTDVFYRTCDIVFTCLTPRILSNVPIEHLPHAYADNRMYRQWDHVGERTGVLNLARKLRDA